MDLFAKKAFSISFPLIAKITSQLFAIVFSFLIWTTFVVTPISAQRGCCSYHGGVSHCAANGRYVCNDGSYSPSCTCGGGYYVPPVSASTWTLPEMQGSWKFIANATQSYDVQFSWDEITDCTGYSVALQKTAGGNPGPLIDTTTNSFAFRNVQPGTYYANLKCKTHGTWTVNTRYWKIEVPEWKAPTPTPSLRPSPSPAILDNPDTTNSSWTENDFWFFIGAIFCLWLVYTAIKIAFEITISLINYIRTHEEIWGMLFWGILICGYLLWIFVEDKPSESNSSTKSKYICNCSKTCPHMTCSEAYFQLNECGCSARDGDDDGVPCEAQCK